MNFEQEYFYLQEEYDNTDTQENFIFTATIKNGNTSSTATLDIASLSYEADAGRTVDYEIWNTSKADTLVKGKIDISKDSATGQALNVDIQALEDGTITAKLKANYVTQGSSGWVTTNTITKDSIKPTGYKIKTFSWDEGSDTASFSLDLVEGNAKKIIWNIDGKGDPINGEFSVSDITAEAQPSKSGIPVGTLGKGQIQLKVKVVDGSGNEGDFTEIKETLKDKVITATAGIFGFNIVPSSGWIPGQDNGNQNFTIIMVVLSLLVVIISIIGADFPWMPNILGYWGWITNTIAIYRLNIFNVLIVFVILFLGLLGYMYWIGHCSTYKLKDTDQATVDEKTTKFFGGIGINSDVAGTVALIAGFVMACLPGVLFLGAILKPGGNWRNHYTLMISTIACSLIVGFGFLPRYLEWKKCGDIFKKQMKVTTFTVSLVEIIVGLMLLIGTAISGSFSLHYIIRTFLSSFTNYNVGLPKFSRGFYGMFMSLVTMIRNTIYSVFIMIANIFGGLSFFTTD